MDERALVQWMRGPQCFDGGPIIGDDGEQSRRGLSYPQSYLIRNLAFAKASMREASMRTSQIC